MRSSSRASLSLRAVSFRMHYWPLQNPSRTLSALIAFVLAPSALTSCDSVIAPDDDSITGQTIITGGLIRYYEWTAPAGDQAKPVLFVFHGYGGNAAEIRLSTDMSRQGKDAGYVVVFPQASNEAGRGWTMGCENCTEGDRRGVNDVTYVDAILDDLARRTPIDRSRVYAAGFSMGAWFTGALACHRPGLLRAIAPLGGLMPRPIAALCTSPQPVGALVIFGDADPTQPYNGSPGQFGLFGVDSSAIFWSDVANCRVERPSERKTFGSTQVDVLRREDCDGGKIVERHSVIGLNHVWPSGSYDASREILRFFAVH
jgi:polyhydroxybutyrate depolymerase